MSFEGLNDFEKFYRPLCHMQMAGSRIEVADSLKSFFPSVIYCVKSQYDVA
jgi:hypothetical protein